MRFIFYTVLILIFLLFCPSLTTAASGWDHDYPRLANQHFGSSPADWYARFDLIVAKTAKDVIQATKVIDPTTKFLFTEGIIGPPPDKSSDIMKCDGWTDSFFALRSDGTVAQAGSPWAPRLGDMSSLPQTLRNNRGERYNEYGPRCMTEFAVNGGYDGVGTDWVWHKPRAGDIDMDRNGVNDYTEHGTAWVDSTYVAGVSDFVANWRKEVNKQFGDSSVPIWLNSGTLHDNSVIAGSMTNSNGPEYEKKSGFRSFSYDWKQYQQWITSGRKPTVWISDIRPAAADPYSYKRGGHTKNYFELMRMMLSFTLMGDGYFEFNPIEAGEHKYYAYFDEYDVPLGYPTSSPQTLSNGVMVRFFEGGAAVMNPNGYSVIVSDNDLKSLAGYQGPYWRFLGGQDSVHNNGQKISSITLDGHVFADQSVGDGIILTKQQKTVVSDIIVDHIEGFTSSASRKAQLSGTWIDSPDQGNAWAQRQAAWQDPEPLFAYKTSTQSGATAKFVPTIGIPGGYKIYEWHPTVVGACSNVNYEIYINGVKNKTSNVNQNSNTGKWNLLDQFNLNKGESSFVEIISSGGCVSVADAMMFVFQDGSTPGTKKGDLNSDGKVDVIDLGILLSSWGRVNKPPADINQDGRVDVVDLGILLSNWGK